MTERWQSFRDFYYEVSDQGRVRNLTSGRLLNPVLNRTGYTYVTFYGQGAPKQLRTHRVVTEAFLGPCPPGHHVHHINSDRADNRLSNLMYVLPEQHVAIENRYFRGEDNGHAILTAAQVQVIRERFAHGERIATIARDYPSVSYWGVSRAAHRKTWRQLV